MSEKSIQEMVRAAVVAIRGAGCAEDARRGLAEADDSVIPLLVSEFRKEGDAKVRAVLIEAIWQHRESLVCEILEEALCDSEALVWKSALDGLVTHSNHGALSILRRVRAKMAVAGAAVPEKIGWIDEAIEQIEEDAPIA